MTKGPPSAGGTADRTLGMVSTLSAGSTSFLPADRQERPAEPRWLPIGIIVSIISIVVIGLVWASLFHIEIVATAKGKIVPTDRAKIIRAHDDGVVKTIHVRNGDRIKRGQPVISFDRIETAADLKRLMTQQTAYRSERSAIQSVLMILESDRLDAEPLGLIGPMSRVSSGSRQNPEKDFVFVSFEHYQTALTLLDAETASLEAEKRRNHFEIKSYEARLPLLRERVTNLERLMDQKTVARPVYLEVAGELIEIEYQLQQAIQMEKRLLASLAQLPTKSQQATAAFKQQLLTRLAELETGLAAIEADLVKVDEKHRLKVLTAPIDGVVEHLAIYTIGSTVTRGHDLMTIVPIHDRLELEAHLANKDVGFVTADQAVNVKLHPFPAARYGSVPGTVIDVADDATRMPNGDWAYAVRVRLLTDDIAIGERRLWLSSGMTADLDIVTGDRRLISYLFEPITDVIQSAFRER